MSEFFKRLIEEIHKRSLWQVTLVYVGGGWAMLGHVDLLKEFGAPEGVFEAAAIILVVGYVVVLGIAAWPRVMRRVAPAKATEVMEEIGGGSLLPSNSGVRPEPEEVESVHIGSVGETPEEIRRILLAFKAGEISREDLARLHGKEGVPEDTIREDGLGERPFAGAPAEPPMVKEDTMREDALGGRPLAGAPAKPRMTKAPLSEYRRMPLTTAGVLFVLAIGLMLVLWGGTLSGGGSPVRALFLVALWPITVILGYSLIRRRTAI